MSRCASNSRALGGLIASVGPVGIRADGRFWRGSPWLAVFAVCVVARLETPATPGFRDLTADLAADLASRDFGASLVRVPPPRGFARDDVFVLPRRMPFPALTRFA